ncbi:MAG: biotin-dependent carboxyltransferase family protein [Mycobacteriales bacterium]
MTRAVGVIAPGPLTTIQDLGRPGYAALGVGRSGAADPVACRLANRLLGNRDPAAALEATLGGLTIRAHGPVTVAVTGAPCPLRRDGRPVRAAEPVRLDTGTTLELGTPPTGLRSYVAVRGGFDVPPVLGSRSCDVLAGLGPPPLRAGDVLAVGTDPATPMPATDVAVTAVPFGSAALEVSPGPRCVVADLRPLLHGRYVVTADCDRVGVRLDGPPLPTDAGATAPSEGAVTGAVQLPPDGRPIVFLTDHPTTGGYPVVAVLTQRAIGTAAQLRPGQGVRFVPAVPDRVTAEPQG